MSYRRRVFTFDVEKPSLDALAEGLPEWEIVLFNGATHQSIVNQWNPGDADLLVINGRANVADTFWLCRFLAFCTQFSEDSRAPFVAGGGPGNASPDTCSRHDASILVLLPAAQAHCVQAVLRAGAHTCLILPIQANDVVRMKLSATAGNRPGRHTLMSERAQTDDPWQDEGGEA